MPRDNELKIPGGDDLHRFVLETFAVTGRSPTLEQIRSRMSLSTIDEAEESLAELERRGSIHRKPGDGAVTHAYPFSDEPTAHRVRLAGGPEVYAMCAIDALGMPFMLRKDAVIVSTCAGCGRDVRVEIASGRIAAHDPAHVAVWYGTVEQGCVPATDLCPDLNFFCSPEHLAAWSHAQADRTGEALTLDEALRRGRQVFEDLLGARSPC